MATQQPLENGIVGNETTKTKEEFKDEIVPSVAKPILEPMNTLRDNSNRWGLPLTEVDFACKMDSTDPLRGFRDKFFYPKMGGLPRGEFWL